MAPTLEQINEYRKSLGKPALTSATTSQTTVQTKPQTLSEKYGIQPPPQEEPGIVSKLGNRISKLGEGLKDVATSYTSPTPGSDSAKQGLIGLTKVGGAIGGGISDIGETITKPFTDLAGAAINKGREVQKANDTAAIAQGTLKPEQALSNKPLIENQIAEAVAPTVKTATEEYKKLSPDSQEVVSNLGDIASGALTLSGAESLIKSGPGKAVTKALSNAKDKLATSLYNYADESAKAGVKTELNSFLNSKKSLINKVQEASKKNIDLVDEISDPDIYKLLKPVEGKVQVDDAINVIDDRIDKALTLKREFISEVDRFVPKTPKEIIREKALADIKGTMLPDDEASLAARINKQIDALPDELSLSDIDTMRARARQSARDAKGQMKSDSEYAAMENALRDTEFEITDRLAFSGGKFKDVNNYIRKQIEVKNFLDKTMRGQVVKGGKLGVYGGRAIGAIAGAAGGPLATLASSEVGGYIAKIMMDRQLGNTLKMRFIKQVTDDPEIIAEAEKILQGAKDYEIPKLPPRGMGTATGEPIKVAPEAPVGTFETTGKTPLVTPGEDYSNPKMLRQNTANSTTPIIDNVSNIDTSIPQATENASEDLLKKLTPAQRARFDAGTPEQQARALEDLKMREDFSIDKIQTKGGSNEDALYEKGTQIRQQLLDERDKLQQELKTIAEKTNYKDLTPEAQKQIDAKYADKIERFKQLDKVSERDLPSNFTTEGLYGAELAKDFLNTKIQEKDDALFKLFNDFKAGKYGEQTTENAKRLEDEFKKQYGVILDAERSKSMGALNLNDIYDIVDGNLVYKSISKKTSGKMSGFAQMTKDTTNSIPKIHPEDADSLNDFLKYLNGETTVPKATAEAMRKEAVDLADHYGIKLGKNDRNFADNIAKALYEAYHKLPGFADLGILPKAAIATGLATGGLKAYVATKNDKKSK